MAKSVIIHVNNPVTGAYIGNWANFSFQGFTKEIDSGPSECIVVLDKTFGSIDTTVVEGNDVEIRIEDADTIASGMNGTDMSSRIIYNGYISLIERDASPQSEKVTVHMLGYYTRLGLDVLKNGSQTTLYSYASGLTVTAGSQAACDIGLMARAVIDRFRSENSTKLWYDTDRIPLTSTTATYAFEQVTYRQALDTLRRMAPAGTFYYISETGEVVFKTKPTTPTHKFVYGRHFTDVHVERSLEKVRNALLVWNGETGGSKVYKHYEDADSITLYGRRAETYSDYGIDNVDGADLIGARFLAENKTPPVRVICTIADNNGPAGFGYDIESIQPGDTCSFYGFSQGFDFIFQDNMLIRRVNYRLDSAEIEVEVVKSGLQDFQDQQGTEIAKIQSGGLRVPESYT